MLQYYKKVQEYAQKIGEKGVLLALDFGKKRIGIARSNTDRTVVLPLTTILNVQEKNIYLKQVIEECNVCGIIIGLPLGLSGNYTAITQSASSFALSIARMFPDIPVLQHDERLSSGEAERRLLYTKKDARRKNIDSVAAQVLLERFLDELSGRISFGEDL